MMGESARRWRIVGYNLLAGLLGTALMLAAWHAYLDHRDFHALLDFVSQQVARANAPMPPRPPGLPGMPPGPPPGMPPGPVPPLP